MFWREHAPPHFHALYAEHEALIDIRTLEVIGGSLPRIEAPRVLRRLQLLRRWSHEQVKEVLP
jgi:hypothetical protein